jgi:hypothetical protein
MEAGMYCGWLKLDDALFATVISGRPATRYHLIAERLPYTERWDWTVWRPGHSEWTVRHGEAPSAATAMRAAEAAVGHPE